MTKSINLLGVRINEIQVNAATLSKSIDVNIKPNILSPRTIEPKTVQTPINVAVVPQIDNKQI